MALEETSLVVLQKLLDPAGQEWGLIFPIQNQPQETIPAFNTGPYSVLSLAGLEFSVPPNVVGDVGGVAILGNGEIDRP